MDYEKELDIAMDLARKAGESILNSTKNDSSISYKEDGSKVTLVDINSDTIIIKGLKDKFPGDCIVSEESSKARGEREWHIDPLDGTDSFILGSSEYSINIGLCEKGSPVLGVVFKPATKELYFAIKGKGAYKMDLNGQKYPLSVKANSLNEMTAIISYNEKTREKIQRILNTLEVKNSVTMAGAGLRIVNLAENKGDIFLTPALGTKTWDFCAPQIILEEAGGCMEYLGGEKVKYADIIGFPKHIIATRSKQQMNFIQEKLSDTSHY